MKRSIDQKFAVISYAAALCISAVASSVIAATVDTSSQLYLYLCYLVPQVGYISVFAVMWLVRNKQTFGELLDRKDVKGVHYVFAVLAAVGILFFALLPNYYVQKLIALFGSSATTVVPEFNEWWTYITGLLVICVLPAVGEELIFRKAFCDGMKGVADYKVILLCGLAFSLSHLNLAQTVHQFVLGCMLGYIYVKTRNITLTMLIHFVNNAIALYAESITGAEFWNNITVLAVSCAVGLVVLAGGLFGLYKTSNRLDNKKTGKIEWVTTLLIGVLALAWAICVAVSFM